MAMMQFAQGSFCTSMRVIGELPYVMMFFVAAGAAWLASVAIIRTASPT
jgi:hypothetical protein